MKKFLSKKFVLPIILAVFGVAVLVQFSAPQAKAETKPEAKKPANLEFLNTKDAWQVRCNEGADAASPTKGQCEIVQRLSIQETGQRLIEFAIGYPAEKENARGVLILPTGILLEQGLSMAVDENKPMAFKPRYCLPNGCFAFVSLNETVLEAFRKGGVVNIEMTQMNGEKLSIPMPLSGFSAALDKVS